MPINVHKQPLYLKRCQKIEIMINKSTKISVTGGRPETLVGCATFSAAIPKPNCPTLHKY